MSTGSVAGGYTAVRVLTTPTSSSVSISGLLNGTNWGPAEAANIEDAGGQQIMTGVDLGGTVRTSLVTGTTIETLTTYAVDCTDVYFRYVGIDGTSPLLGPARIGGVLPGGAEARDLHSTTINWTGFDNKASAMVSY